MTGLNGTITREMTTETLFIFDVGFLIFVAVYLVRQIAEAGLATLTDRLGNRAAIAIGLHVLGLTIIRGWSVAMYWMRAHGMDPGAVEDQYGVGLVGLLIAVVGMAFCIRIFSPAGWGHWGWMIVFANALLFVGYMRW